MVTISTRVKRFDEITAIAEAHPEVWCSVGTHPHNAARGARHRRPPTSCGSAQHPRCVAIGEAGLDYHYEGDYAAQATGFRRHIAAARETGLPLVIHSRSADDDTAKILEEETEGRGPSRSSSTAFPPALPSPGAASALGGYISFSGILTFKNADGNPGGRGARRRPTASWSKPTRRTSRRCRIAGRANEPAYVRHTAEKLAELRGVSLEEIGAPDHGQLRAALQQDRAARMAEAERIVATIMGCGSSGGVPRIGGNWGVCDPANPRNRRRRCSLLIEGSTAGSDEPTRIVIDTGCDLREQLLDAEVDRVDAVLLHPRARRPHARHRRPARAWRSTTAGASTSTSRTRPAQRIVPQLRVLLHGAARQRLSADPQPAHDRRRRAADDRRAGRLDHACCRSARTTATSPRSASGSAASPIPATSAASRRSRCDAVSGLDVWVLDALRPTPHPSHLSLPESLELIARMQPREAVLTNLHIDLDYAETDAHDAGERPAGLRRPADRRHRRHASSARARRCRSTSARSASPSGPSTSDSRSTIRPIAASR